MKILITGVNGFVGTHLVHHLTDHVDAELFGWVGPAPYDQHQLHAVEIHLQSCELRDAERVHQLLQDIQPDYIFHLAAQAFVPASFEDPWATLEVNLKGQVNLFQSMLKLNLNSRVLIVSSAEVYGKIRADENPVTEDQPFRPTNPYSVSKVGQDMLAYQYFLSHELPTVRARAFNHIGPGQTTRFAIPNFATQIAAIEAGKSEPVIKVGNLSAERDFTDVRDVVRAYQLMLMRGEPGAVYNVCSGNAYAIGDLLDMMIEMSSADLHVEIDPERLRPVDMLRVQGDSSKLRQATDWQPTIDIQQSLSDILEDARKRRNNS